MIAIFPKSPVFGRFWTEVIVSGQTQKSDMVDRYVPMVRPGCSLHGVPRTALYQLGSEGRIRLVKRGHRTMIDVQSLIEHLDNLPAATLTRAKKASA